MRIFSLALFFIFLIGSSLATPFGLYGGSNENNGDTGVKDQTKNKKSNLRKGAEYVAAGVGAIAGGVLVKKGIDYAMGKYKGNKAENNRNQGHPTSYENQREPSFDAMPVHNEPNSPQGSYPNQYGN